MADQLWEMTRIREEEDCQNLASLSDSRTKPYGNVPPGTPQWWRRMQVGWMTGGVSSVINNFDRGVSL